MEDIVKRLLAACDGHPHAKIKWPHRLLHDAADEIIKLRKKLSPINKKSKNIHPLQAMSEKALRRVLYKQGE